MRRLRASPDPLRRASSCRAWLMNTIGATHSGAQSEVGARVKLPIGVARTLSTRWRSIDQREVGDDQHDQTEADLISVRLDGGKAFERRRKLLGDGRAADFR